MGDCSTHLIFYQAYWYLVYSNNEVVIDSRNQETVCHIGHEEKKLELSEVQ